MIFLSFHACFSPNGEAEAQGLRSQCLVTGCPLAFVGSSDAWWSMWDGGGSLCCVLKTRNSWETQYELKRTVFPTHGSYIVTFFPVLLIFKELLTVLVWVSWVLLYITPKKTQTLSCGSCLSHLFCVLKHRKYWQRCAFSLLGSI